MPDKYNELQVETTLRMVIKMMEKYDVEYRVLGSVVASAINEDQHRKLGDVDLLVDKRIQKRMIQDLEKVGYYAKGGMFSFGRKYLNLDTMNHKELLEVGMFWGNFNSEGDFVLGRHWKTWADGSAIMPTKYQLHGVSFVGLPKATIYRGIMTSSSNPKRKNEIKIMKEAGIKPELRKYMHMSIFGIRIDWVYELIMWVLNLIGFIRVKMGKPFDPWR